jgi:hypothetical protein
MWSPLHMNLGNYAAIVRSLDKKSIVFALSYMDMLQRTYCCGCPKGHAHAWCLGSSGLTTVSLQLQHQGMPSLLEGQTPACRTPACVGLWYGHDNC